MKTKIDELKSRSFFVRELIVTCWISVIGSSSANPFMAIPFHPIFKIELALGKTRNNYLVVQTHYYLYISNIIVI
jgi:hypothetical protein